MELICYILDQVVFVHLLAGFKLPQIYQLAERFSRLVLLRFGYLFGHLMAITVIALEAGVILHVAVSIRHYRISRPAFILRCLLHYRLQSLHQAAVSPFALMARLRHQKLSLAPFRGKIFGSSGLLFLAWHQTFTLDITQLEAIHHAFTLSLVWQSLLTCELSACIRLEVV